MLIERRSHSWESRIMASQFSPPTTSAPLLLGILVDVSGSMTQSIQTDGSAEKTRLESFRDSFEQMVKRGQQLSKQSGADRILPLLSIFAYGFGFNVLSLFRGGGL